MSDLAHKATLIYEDKVYTVGLHRMTGYNMLGKYCFIRLFHRLTEDFFFCAVIVHTVHPFCHVTSAISCAIRHKLLVYGNRMNIQ